MEIANIDNAPLVQSIIDILVRKKESVSIAESCTGGLLSYQFTRLSGASSVFVGSVISYQNNAKVKILGVAESTITEFSPYSNEVVEQMLDGILGLTDSTYALATSGIAGPSGGNDTNPVGSVYIGAKKRFQQSSIIKVKFDGNREAVQSQASRCALELLYQLIVA